MSSNGNIQDLSFTARHNPGHFQLMIADGNISPWDGVDSNDFEQAFQTILSVLQAPRLEELFKLCILGKILLAPSHPVCLI